MKIPDGAARTQSGNAPPVYTAPPEASIGLVTAVSASDRMAPR